MSDHQVVQELLLQLLRVSIPRLAESVIIIRKRRKKKKKKNKFNAAKYRTLAADYLFNRDRAQC